MDEMRRKKSGKEGIAGRGKEEGVFGCLMGLQCTMSFFHGAGISSWEEVYTLVRFTLLSVHLILICYYVHLCY